MQFYLNGYNPGDPDIQAAAPGAEARPAALPHVTDVLIVGTGPAGMLLAAQLSAFPGITTRIVERREGPLQVGQADGVACRTVEMFDAFGLSGKLIRDAYWVSGKPGAVVSTSPGAIGGFGANHQLRQPLVFLMAQPEVYLGGADKLFDANGGNSCIKASCRPLNQIIANTKA